MTNPLRNRAGLALMPSHRNPQVHRWARLLNLLTQTRSQSAPVPAPASSRVTSAPPLILPDYEYSSTQVNLPGENAAVMLEAARALVSEHDLAGDGFEAEPHITVKYGITEDPKTALPKLQRAFSGMGTILAHLTTMGLFRNNAEFDVLYVAVASTDLMWANRVASEAVACVSLHPVYLPHLTLAYIRKGSCDHLAGDPRFFGRVLRFDSVSFSARDRSMTPISLNGSAGDPDFAAPDFAASDFAAPDAHLQHWPEPMPGLLVRLAQMRRDTSPDKKPHHEKNEYQ